MGLAMRIEDFTQDEDIISTTNRIRARENWSKDAVREVAFCLTGGRTVKGPVWELATNWNGFGDAFGLRTHLIEHQTLKSHGMSKSASTSRW
mmetsp:Transcript_7556/g.46456  ORF Transcript_7556/g.46456 Transcript_7556/m.46456 type:complete len:92 (+) Transcript_7556:1879-2154(+)